MQMQRNHFYRVEIQSGIFLVQETENTQMDSEQIEPRERDTGNRRGKTGELRHRIDQ